MAYINDRKVFTAIRVDKVVDWDNLVEAESAGESDWLLLLQNGETKKVSLKNITIDKIDLTNILSK